MAYAEVDPNLLEQPAADRFHLYEVPLPDDPQRSFFNPDAVISPGFKYYGDAPLPDVVDQWPNQRFVFNEHKLLGHGVVAATRASRLHSVVDAVAENPINLVAFHLPEGQSLTRSLETVEKLLAKTVKIGGRTGKYQELLPPEAPLAIIEAVWKEDNNPILQALQQLRAQYQEELLPGDLTLLVRDTIYSTQQATIAQMYTSHRHNFGKS